MAKAPETAANKFAIGAQVRTRYEWNDNDFNSGDPNLPHLLRTRVHLKS